MTKVFALATAIASLAVSAHAQAAAANASAPIQPADWEKKPTGADVAAVYPSVESSGFAVMQCAIGIEGVPKDCRVVAEAPARKGFGKAALRLAKLFKTKPVPTGASVTIPITFRLVGKPAEIPIPIEDVGWTSVPSASDLISAFPQAAMGKVQEATVDLNCYIDDAGRLAACTPHAALPGMGFEKAALAQSQKFSVDPVWRARIDHVLMVKLRIQFAAPDSDVWKSHPLGKIHWVQAADLEMAQSAFPMEALKAGLMSGSAAVDCTVAKDGALTHCTSDTESPPGLGFGQAVAQVAEHYVMNPWAETGLPAEGAHISMPMKLVHGPEDASANPSTKP